MKITCKKECEKEGANNDEKCSGCPCRVCGQECFGCEYDGPMNFLTGKAKPDDIPQLV